MGRGSAAEKQQLAKEAAEAQPQPARQIRYRPRAAIDLESAVVYLGEVCNAPQAAKRLYDDITHALEQLRDLPTMGKPFLDDRLDRKLYRTWLVGNYRIFYSFDIEWITVWRIVHTSQDIDDYAIMELSNNL